MLSLDFLSVGSCSHHDPTRLSSLMLTLLLSVQTTAEVVWFGYLRLIAAGSYELEGAD